MTLCSKYISRKVHKTHQQEPDSEADGAPWTTLTVWRKSLVFSCKGFTVIDSSGSLVFRVDNYTGRRPEEVTLMDGPGMPVLTMRHRKKLRLVDNWLVYEGEVGDYSSKKPSSCVRKQINFLQPNSNVLARVYCGPSDKKFAYTIEGSYVHRSCRVLDESTKLVVAEIKRKESMGCGVSFGLEVFLLNVRPGFSLSFAMAIVLILDQMFS